jgi:hypothetical protein
MREKIAKAAAEKLRKNASGNKPVNTSPTTNEPTAPGDNVIVSEVTTAPVKTIPNSRSC